MLHQTGIEGPLIGGIASVVTAIIAALVSLVGAGLAWLSARNLEQRKGEIAKEAATHASTLRVDSERQLELFRLAATEIRDSANYLIEWRDALRDYSAHTSAEGGEAWLKSGPGIEAIGRRAEKVGLLLPPELDQPFLAALAALEEGTKAVSGHSILLGQGYNTAEWVNKRFRGKEGAEAAVRVFLEESRKWKAGEWPLKRKQP